MLVCTYHFRHQPQKIETCQNLSKPNLQNLTKPYKTLQDDIPGDCEQQSNTGGIQRRTSSLNKEKKRKNPSSAFTQNGFFNNLSTQRECVV